MITACAGTRIDAGQYFRPYLTPNGDDVWQGVEFIRNPGSGKFDAVVVVQSVRPLGWTPEIFCPPTRLLLAVVEPPEILRLPAAYVRQYFGVVSQDPFLKTNFTRVGPSGHHSFIETPWREALDRAKWPKTERISAVVSNKTSTVGHRTRLEFMRAAKLNFGDRLDWYGRGVNELGDRKADGLLPYKYHIALENCQRGDYFTEKLIDGFCANCFTFYWGAPNAGRYFPSGAFAQIDISDPQAAISLIETAMASNIYDRRQNAISKARRVALTELHPFEIYLNILQELPESDPKLVSLRGHDCYAFSYAERWGLRLWRWGLTSP